MLAFAVGLFSSMEDLANSLVLKHRYMPPYSRRRFKNECDSV